MREIVVYIRSRNKFGDQIVSFAALYQLKQWWPDAQLRIAAQHDVASYYRLLPWVDDFIRYGSFLQMLRSLPRKTDMAVCLHHSSERYGLVTLLRQATVRLGFSNDRVFDFAWTHTWRKNVNEYIGLANLYLLNAYRPVDPESTFRRCFERIAALAPEARAQAHVVLIPGGGDGNFKRWGIRNFVALVDLLKARLGPHTRFAFVLGPAESAERAALQALNRPDFELVSGCSFPELTALMLRAPGGGERLWAFPYRPGCLRALCGSIQRRQSGVVLGPSIFQTCLPIGRIVRYTESRSAQGGAGVLRSNGGRLRIRAPGCRRGAAIVLFRARAAPLRPYSCPTGAR